MSANTEAREHELAGFGVRAARGLQLLLKNEQLLWVGRADKALFMNSDWEHDYLPYYSPPPRKPRRRK